MGAEESLAQFPVSLADFEYGTTSSAPLHPAAWPSTSSLQQALSWNPGKRRAPREFLGNSLLGPLKVSLEGPSSQLSRTTFGHLGPQDFLNLRPFESLAKRSRLPRGSKTPRPLTFGHDGTVGGLVV